MYLSNGNKKLKSDKENQFMVWSLPRLITCPYATEMCKRLCYARHAERMYKRVIPVRMQNLEDSKQPDFVEKMVATISAKRQVNKTVWVRIHEDGDFYNQEYFDNWVKIAAIMDDIHFMAYTKSIAFIADTKLSIPDNLTLRFSIWDDTKQSDIDSAAKLGLGTFQAVPKEELHKYAGYHCINDCQKCKVCYSKQTQAITNYIH